MTDRIFSEREIDGGLPGGNKPPACDRFDAPLPDWLEGTLPNDARTEADAHLARCARCRALADDLAAITRQAAALGPIQPARDLWAGIEARIQAPVVPISRTGEYRVALARERQRHRLSRRWLVAAAGILVAVSVGSTMLVMRSTGRTTTTVAAAPSVAPSSIAPSSVAPSAVAPLASAPSAGAPSAGAPSAGAPSAGAPSAGAPSAGAPPARRDARLVTNGGAYLPAVHAYDKEIGTLRQALRQRADLDSSTVAVLERNLRIIDEAIAQSRRALDRDPHSRLLGDQLTRALDQKVELLRTAVLLPARS